MPTLSYRKGSYYFRSFSRKEIGRNKEVYLLCQKTMICVTIYLLRYQSLSFLVYGHQCCCIYAVFRKYFQPKY